MKEMRIFQKLGHIHMHNVLTSGTLDLQRKRNISYLCVFETHLHEKYKKKILQQIDGRLHAKLLPRQIFTKKKN